MESIKRFAFIDALRCWAITGVIIFHCVDGASAYSESLKSILLHGNKGVQLFYIISALTIFLTLKDREGVDPRLFANFFMRRFFRIAPMYYLAILFSLIMFWAGVAYSYLEVTPGNVVANFLFVHGVSPYWINGLVPGGWSITVEITFYLLAPFLFKRVRDLSAAIMFLVGSLFVSSVYNKVMMAWQGIDDPALWKEFVYFSFPNQLPVFALGIVMYFILYQDEKKVSSHVILVAGIYVMATLLLQTFRLPVIFYFGFAFCLLVLALGRRPYWVFVNPVSIYLGRISYSMYIVHFAVLFFLKKWLPPALQFVHTPAGDFLNFLSLFVFTTLITVAISAISYRLIELPFIRWSKTLTNKVRYEKAYKAYT